MSDLILIWSAPIVIPVMVWLITDRVFAFIVTALNTFGEFIE